MVDVRNFQWPANVEGKVIGWGTDGKFLENKDVATPADLEGKQDAADNLDTLAGAAAPGASGLAVLAAANTAALTTAIAGAVDDDALATFSVVRNRNLDQAMLTDYFTTASKQSQFRAGSNPDITQELNDMDAALGSGGVAYIPKYSGTITGTVSKQLDTHWVSPGSTIFGTWTCAYNGNIIEIINPNTHASRDGGISGIRLIGDNVTYPGAIAIYAENTYTHVLKDLRIGGFDYGIYGLNNVAMHGANLYVFDCLTDGHYEHADADGDALTWSSDHRWYDCQWTGNRYGFHADTVGTIKMTACRPQASGVANLRIREVDDFQFNGGFIDSARYFDSFTGGGHGAMVVDCDRASFIGASFFDNGIVGDSSKTHLSVSASVPMRGLNVMGCTFKDYSGTPSAIPMRGIAFSTPSGTGAYRYGRIIGNDFSECFDPLVGMANLGRNWRIRDNVGVSDVQFVTTNGTSDVVVTANTRVVRVTGQNNNCNIVMPGPGHHTGKVVEVWFESGSGTVTIERPDASTSITTMTTGNRKSFICTSENDTVTSAIFA